jgi:hypothetical protein
VRNLQLSCGRAPAVHCEIGAEALDRKKQDSFCGPFVKIQHVDIDVMWNSCATSH